MKQQNNTFTRPTPKPKIQKGSPSPQPKSENDYYRTNKHITDRINNLEKSRKEAFQSSQASIAKKLNPVNNNAYQGHSNPGKAQPANPNSDFKPSIADQALLQYMLEMKFMKMDQIDRKFLKSQSSAESFRKLLADGYLKSKDEAPNPESLIIPTEKAYELLKVENPNKDVPKPLKRVFEPAINHDLKLVELRMRFEELNFIKKWYSEKALEEVPMMNRLFEDLPDAVCKKPNDKSYFLELEISRKSPKVYEERIKEYERVLDTQEIKEYGIEGVIFLCTDERVHAIISSMLPKSKNFSCLMLDRYLKTQTGAA